MTKRAIFWYASRGGKSWASSPNGGTQPKKARKRSGRAPRPRPDPKPVDDIADLPEVTGAGRRVIVPFPPVELSPNFRGHWSTVAKVKKAYRRLCWALALEAGLSPSQASGPLRTPGRACGGNATGDQSPIIVRLDFFPPDRASRDDDNVSASFKAGRDGIADALKCDDARFVTTNVLHTAPRSCVVVTLIDQTGGAA
ncbi:hypothetical protein [Tsuneonella suprasediminis]|uniref:hypothetical protein n=1 Tax=Tsuneonella suprasediminis TaxID=2306996 RepID=UPI002F95160C